MAQANRESQLTARIVYWGGRGSGKTTSLRTIYARLKADRRGQLEQIPTRLDPTVTYEELAVEIGSLRGTRTQLRITAVPGSPEQAHTRKQLLDRVDGVVLVFDCRSEQLAENLASLAELRECLAAYGRSLSEVPTVVQYNKRDLGDPFSVEELHRRLELPDVPVFETIATDGTGILQCLTTISKQVVRTIRERHLEPEPIAPPEPIAATPPVDSPSLTERMPEPSPPPAGRRQPMEPEAVVQLDAAPGSENRPTWMESAILADGQLGEDTNEAAETALEAQTLLDRPWPAVEAELKTTPGARIGADLRIVSVGAASRSGRRAVRLPLVLGNDDGESVTLALTIQLDPLLDDEPT